MKRTISSLTGNKHQGSESSEYSLFRVETSNAILEQSSSHISSLQGESEDVKEKGTEKK